MLWLKEWVKLKVYCSGEQTMVPRQNFQLASTKIAVVGHEGKTLTLTQLSENEIITQSALPFR